MSAVIVRRSARLFARMAYLFTPKRSCMGRILRNRLLKVLPIKDFLRSDALSVLYSRYMNPKSLDAEVLFFGSSHTEYAINPYAHKGQAIWNYGLTCCDLCQTYQLIAHFVPISPYCKKVYVGLDFWQRGMQTEFSSWFIYALAVSELLSLPLRNELFAGRYRKIIDERLVDIASDQATLEKTASGYNSRGTCAYNSAEERASAHIKFLSYKPTELRYLEKIKAFCKRQGVDLVFFIAPCRKDYISVLYRYDAGLNDEIKAAVGDSALEDYFDDDDFGDDDFGDTDHLNLNGAIKFTSKIMASGEGL